MRGRGVGNEVPSRKQVTKESISLAGPKIPTAPLIFQASNKMKEEAQGFPTAWGSMGFLVRFLFTLEVSEMKQPRF
jgi:hypothetical protein